MLLYNDLNIGKSSIVDDRSWSIVQNMVASTIVAIVHDRSRPLTFRRCRRATTTVYDRRSWTIVDDRRQFSRNVDERQQSSTVVDNRRGSSTMVKERRRIVDGRRSLTNVDDL